MTIHQVSAGQIRTQVQSLLKSAQDGYLMPESAKYPADGIAKDLPGTRFGETQAKAFAWGALFDALDDIKKSQGAGGFSEAAFVAVEKNIYENTLADLQYFSWGLPDFNDKPTVEQMKTRLKGSLDKLGELAGFRDVDALDKAVAVAAFKNIPGFDEKKMELVGELWTFRVGETGVDPAKYGHNDITYVLGHDGKNVHELHGHTGWLYNQPLENEDAVSTGANSWSTPRVGEFLGEPTGAMTPYAGDFIHMDGDWKKTSELKDLLVQNFEFGNIFSWDTGKGWTAEVDFGHSAPTSGKLEDVVQQWRSWMTELNPRPGSLPSGGYDTVGPNVEGLSEWGGPGALTRQNAELLLSLGSGRGRHAFMAIAEKLLKDDRAVLQDILPKPSELNDFRYTGGLIGWFEQFGKGGALRGAFGLENNGGVLTFVEPAAAQHKAALTEVLGLLTNEHLYPAFNI